MMPFGTLPEGKDGCELLNREHAVIWNPFINWLLVLQMPL